MRGGVETGESMWRAHWQLAPDLIFLNHGSFGACPSVVLDAQRAWQDQLESDPIRFLAPERELEHKLDLVRHRVAEEIRVAAADIAFVHNATDGVNAVLRSFPFRPGDEVVVTDHGYNACNNAARYAVERLGGSLKVARIPFPIKDPNELGMALEASFTARTRILLIDHVTSFSGLVFPIAAIIKQAHQRGIRVLVDGAHAPGMVDIDLGALKPDYYTANHHKWWCGPKVSGFLYVDPAWQHEVRPNIISHGANRSRPGRSRFLAEFDWTGTYDPTPLLALPTALDFLSSLRQGGMAAHRDANRELAITAREVLAEALNVPPPAPASMIGSLVTLPLPARPTSSDEGAPQDGIDPLQRRLYAVDRIEVPIFPGPKPQSRWLRISCQAYNHLDEYRRLAEALRREGAFF